MYGYCYVLVALNFSNFVQQYNMKKIFLILAITFSLTQITKAQVISCLPCDQLGMLVNVGSQETSISIYHSGQYLTHPRPENIFTWEFSNEQGNILYQDTIVDDAFCNFGHNWSLTDTIDVAVHLVNDSAILANGNSINCLFEDQLFWKIDTFPVSGTPYGTWTFIHNNVGVDQNVISSVNDISHGKKELIKIIDLLGRECKQLKNKPLVYIYGDGTVEKKIVLE